MSQKAWINAFTKGSKSLQDRLARVHANNPEFQSFVQKHGFGSNLSVKQSGSQKKSSATTVTPTTEPHPERSNLDRLAVIKAAAEKQRDRRRAHSNRVAFGGELGGNFSMPGSGFRRYSEEVENLTELEKRTLQSYDAKSKNDLKNILDKGNRWKNRLRAINRVKGLALSQKKLKDKNYGKVTVSESKAEERIKAHPGVSYYGGKSDDHFVELHKGWEMDGQRSFGNPSASEAAKMLKHIKKVQATDESTVVEGAIRDEFDSKIRDNRKRNKPVIIAAHKKLLAKGYTHTHSDGVGTAFDGYDTRHHYISKSGTHKKIMRYDAYSMGYDKKPRIDYETIKLSRKHPDLNESFELHEDLVEEVPFKDASYTMRRGGWVVKRNGKIASAVLPTEKNAKEFINSTRMTLGKKVAAVVRRKAKELARGLGSQSLATESAANRNRIRSWDSAVLPVEHDHGMTTPHPKKKLDALRAAGKHVQARDLERSWLRKSMAKEKLPFTPDEPKKNLGIVVGKNDPGYSRARHLARLGLKKAMEQGK